MRVSCQVWVFLGCAAAPREERAASKDIHKALLWRVLVSHLIHQMHGHAHTLHAQPLQHGSGFMLLKNLFTRCIGMPTHSTRSPCSMVQD